MQGLKGQHFDLENLLTKGEEVKYFVIIDSKFDCENYKCNVQ